MVVIVSGRRLIAEAMQQLLLLHRATAMSTVATTGAELQDALRVGAPSVLLVDLDDPGLDNALLTQLVQKAGRAQRIGFYDAFTVPNAQLAFDLGVTVLLPLASPLEQILDSVGAERRASSVTRSVGLTRRELAGLSSLTEREIEVLNCLALGLPVRSIATSLGVTVHTVQTYKRRSFHKLGVQHQAHAVALAVRAGLVRQA